ncbi:hypothetical protein V466_19800 [Pseudomonas mandelii PD30]|uniref:Uncharacterized protein n=1 Tax=Pseudomonas mandelii PD30 TaxID=1419583 RepID=A0A059KZP3_9PSED|nr:hypothetical protein V466_19800 [Pseudomonas mandelii PD30]
MSGVVVLELNERVYQRRSGCYFGSGGFGKVKRFIEGVIEVDCNGGKRFSYYWPNCLPFTRPVCGPGSIFTWTDELLDREKIIEALIGFGGFFTRLGGRRVGIGLRLWLLCHGDFYATHGQRNGQRQVFWSVFVLNGHRIRPLLIRGQTLRERL